MHRENVPIDVQHDARNSCFVAVVDGTQADLAYDLRDGALRITHTGVPAAIGGRGVAAELVRTALEYARAEGLKVVPACSYAQAYIRRHSQYADLLA